MEYIPRGSLRKILDDPHITLTHDIIVKMARGVAEAMQYLHRMNIVHRDLKSDNMLVGNDWVIKVTDFGLAKLMDRTKEANEKMTRNVGTLAWVAPESPSL
jgi:serine/threonine protein kinase